MDLIFNGRHGQPPDEDSVEYDVLEACTTTEAWPTVLDLPAEEFEDAINRLQRLGWGFEWIAVQ